MSWVGRVGPWVHPDKLNPYYREPPKTPEQEKSEGRQAFALLERALKDLSGGR